MWKEKKKTKNEYYQHNKKQKTKEVKECICNDRVTIKEKGRGTLPMIKHEMEEMISESATVVVGIMDSMSKEIVSCVAPF